MDIRTSLVLLKRDGVFEDATARVCSVDFSLHNKVAVQFNGGKRYIYNSHNVLFFENPVNIDASKFAVYEDDFLIDGEVLDFGDYVKVINRNDGAMLYDKKQVELVPSCLNNNDAKNIFEYFKKLAPILESDTKKETVNEDDMQPQGEHGYLSRQYDKIKNINEKQVLGTYLSKNVIAKNKHHEVPIFPFGINLSQRDAVKNALENQISIIKGPPGTGKTQTILNLIANIVVNNKSVAVVSGNNSATSNVQEKLEKQGVGFLTAMLGNSDNKKEFFECKQSEVPDINDWSKTNKETQNLENDIANTAHVLAEFLEDQNIKAKLKEDMAELEVEKKHFFKNFGSQIMSLRGMALFNNWGSNKLIDLMMLLENYSYKPDKLTKLILFLRFGVYSFAFIDNNISKIMLSLKGMYYIRAISEKQSKIRHIEKKHKGRKSEALMNEYVANSEKLFKSLLCKRYSENKRKNYEQYGFFRDFKSFINDYPVILSTTNSILNSIPQNYMFDYVIIDEASQVDLVTATLSMYCCKNIVIVGDEKQLPHIVSKDNAKEDRKLYQADLIPIQYNYTKHSIISSLSALYGDKIATTLLKEHYRCNPKIIGFCNKQFYDNQLVIMTNENSNPKPLEIYKTVKGRHVRKSTKNDKSSKYNRRQVDVINDEILARGDIVKGIGIITPYKEQVKEAIAVLSGVSYKDTSKPGKLVSLKNILKEDSDIEVDTVHKFQGREKDTIIFSTVEDDINGFIDDEHLVNVAVSRSVNKFMLVVSDSIYRQHGSNLGNLIRYIEYNSDESAVTESQIISVFDLMYSEYSEKLLKIEEQIKKVSEHPSENCFYYVIENILKDPKYSALKCVLHVPLYSIIKDYSSLNEEETKFAKHPFAHVDFLIFNKMDKEPVLVVEVDGVLHREKEKQIIRDNKKDSIMEKINLPLCRVKTVEAVRPENDNKFISALDKAMKIDR